MKFEGGKRREIPKTSTAHDEDEERFRRFQTGRVKAWSAQAGPANLVTEAEYERDSSQRERDSAQERDETYTAKIEELEQEISQLKSSWVVRLKEFRKLRETEERLQMLRHMKSGAEEDRERTEALVVAYDRIIAEERGLSDIKKEAVAQLQQRADERSAAIERDNRARSVGELARKHNCFLVHDIVDAEWKPSENNEAINTKNLSWSDQFDIVYGLGPTVSGSSLREGVEGDGTFGRGSWGVFIQNGKVLGGAPSDIGTRAHGLFERPIDKHKRSIKAIDRAINRDQYPRRANGEVVKGYNELVIERPEVAGIYVKWGPDFGELSEEVSLQNVYEDKAKRIMKLGYDPWWKKMREVLSKNVPIFVLTPDNRTRMIYDVDPDKRTFKVVQADIHPTDMTNLPGIYQQHLGEAEKRVAVMRQIDKVKHLLPKEERQKYGQEN